MLRSLLTLALSMFLLAEASAQTTPAVTPKKTTKTAKAAARVAARNAKKARRVASKSTTVAPLNDGWPPLDNTQTAVASATAADGGWATDAPATSSRGEIDNANVHAAPGMPLHIRTSNGMVPYSVRPARKPASAQTTLGN
ncbi:hypothetical protein [Hymenobacter terrenus]|uniref:hypothetical protein n=1 Tax=Hymenobacter terrenus TaxID=1629124 RepID=UPI000619F2DC|nr:hypothetical protein [Hymenobacter terrenus]